MSGSGLEAFAVSAGVVALGEIGDKTQLLALLLSARFRRPLPIVLGILVASIANHLAAAALGSWIVQAISPQWMRWLLGGSFLAVATWMLVPDKADEDSGVERKPVSAFGIFGIVVLAFFLAEMGDKTQIATVMLAARYDAVWTVAAGTTLGMLLADVPAVLLGDKAVNFVPIAWVHRIAAGVFALLGVLVLAGVGA